MQRSSLGVPRSVGAVSYWVRRRIDRDDTGMLWRKQAPTVSGSFECAIWLGSRTLRAVLSLRRWRVVSIESFIV